MFGKLVFWTEEKLEDEEHVTPEFLQETQINWKFPKEILFHNPEGIHVYTCDRFDHNDFSVFIKRIEIRKYDDVPCIDGSAISQEDRWKEIKESG